MQELAPQMLVAGGGFAIGLLFGAVIQRTNFCSMGAVTDIVLLGNWRRFRSWLLAIAVALLAAQGLGALGVVDLDQSIYLGPRVTWLGAILGGLLFGVGMVFAGGCGSRNLAKLGCGDLRSLIVVIVLGISAYMAIHGLTAPLRVALGTLGSIDLGALDMESQGLGSLVSAATGAPRDALRTGLGLGLAAALIAFCLRDRGFRGSGRHVLAGVALGLLVGAGWWITGVLGADEFDPVPLASLTFVAPVGDSLIYLMTFTGSSLSFGVAVVGGVVIGAFGTALGAGEFRLEAFADRADFLRHLLGAFLMGFGGVTALGCTIGQGITGLSTLALGSFLAFGAIVEGGVIGVRLLDRYAE